MTARGWDVETGVVPPSQVIAYDLPLRPDLLVRLTLPADLTKADADRVAEFVQSLAFPDTPPAALPAEETP